MISYMTNTQVTAVRLVSEKVLQRSLWLKVYLSEYSYTDVLATGFIDESV